MPDILNISSSGLRAYQGALSTTSHNIANVGNEDYTRQRVEFDARNPIRLGSNFFGQGVELTSVNRIIDEFNTISLRDLTSSTSRLSMFESYASRVETIVADEQASLLPALDGFFNALNDVSNDPSASAPRVALLGANELLEQRFLSMGTELQKLETEINGSIRAEISEINAITTELAKINETLQIFSSVDNRPGDILDRRDALLKQLAEKISVTVVEQENGNINVLVGTGQLLVTNSTALQLTTQIDDADPGKLSVAVQTFGGSVSVTDSLVGGELGGLLDFRNNMLNTAQNRLGRTAIAVSEAINAQHIQGYDLNGEFGTNMFSTVSTGHLQAQFGGDYINNGFDNVAGETVSFDLNFDNVAFGPVNVVVNAGDTNDIIGQSMLDAIGLAAGVAANADGSYTVPGATPGVSITFDVYGSNIQFETAGGPSPFGNNLTMSNLADTLGGDASMDLSSLGSSSTRLSSGVVSIGGPVANFIGPSTVAIPNQNNIGTAVMNYSITDISALTVSDYEVRYDGANYQVTRLSDNQLMATGPGPFNVDGIEIVAGGAGAPVLNDSFLIRPTELGAVNFKNLLGDIDKVAAASPVRSITSVANLGSAEISPVSITDSLDGDLTDAVDIFFDPLNPAGTFDVIDQASGAVLQNDVIYFDGINVNQNGWQVQLKGVVEPGDRFTVQENINATSDNRNALLLAGFQSLGVLDSGNTSFEQSYSTLVSEVGVITQQVQINLDVEESLLDSAIERRESVSGVNLDEEAADLIRFQQAYQAMSRVVQTAQELFDSLLAAV